MQRTAGVGEELVQRVERLLAAPEWDDAAGRVLGDWFERTFKLDMTRTPRGQKALKNQAQGFVWEVKHRIPMSQDREEGKANVQFRWDQLKPHVPTLVAKFTDEGAAAAGKKAPPAEVTVGQNRYLNSKGLTHKTFHKYVGIMEGIFNSLRGWRRKALTGGVTVNLVGARDIRAKAKYHRAGDVMMIKAIPSIMKVQPGAYGSFDYIVVHELGHRYEDKVGTRMDFNTQKWETTNYSRRPTMSGGEQFAELFATGHYGITSIRGNEFADKLRWFEGLMSGSMQTAEVLREMASVSRWARRVVHAYLAQIDEQDAPMTLRKATIRLAHANPDLRPHLLPLLTAAYDQFYQQVNVRDLPPFVRKALKEVKYNRRTIEIKTNTTYSAGSAGGAGRKSFVIPINLGTGQYKVEWGSWGGSNMYNPRNQVDLDFESRPLPTNGAVIKGSYGGGPTWATLLIHPSNVAALLPDPGDEVELSREEEKALVMIGTYNSGGRRDDFPRHGLGRYGPDNPFVQSLASKGLVKIMARGVKETTKGTNLRKSRKLSLY